MIYANPWFWVVVAGAASVIYGFYYWIVLRGRNKEDSTGNPPELVNVVDNSDIAPYSEPNGSILVRMADNLLARIYNTTISQPTAEKIIKEHGSLGRQWDRDGKKIFGLNRYFIKDDKGVDTKKVSLRPIFVPKEISNAPNQLHNDTCQPEIAIIISEMIKSDENKMGEQIMKYLPWLIAAGVVAFFWMVA